MSRSQFLRLRRLCREDSDFSLKSEEMCYFFDKRGYPASVVQAGHHPAQQIDRQSALQTSQKENDNRIPFTITFHLHNHAVKSIILKNLKLPQNDPDTGRIFSQPPLISFKRNKNIRNFLVRSAFQTSNPPELLNAHAHDAKHVLSFATLRNCLDQSDPLRSLIISPQPSTLETSAFESLYGGQFTLSTQLIKPNYLVILPPTQHHSFFRNLPPLLVV